MDITFVFGGSPAAYHGGKLDVCKEEAEVDYRRGLLPLTVDVRPDSNSVSLQSSLLRFQKHYIVIEALLFFLSFSFQAVTHEHLKH